MDGVPVPMQFTRKAEYAVLALIDLASQESGEFALSRDVAARQHIPGKFIAQIMAALSKAGWVEGQRGSQGGVRLGVAADKLTLLGVIEAIDGPLAINPCLAEDYACPQESTCPLHSTWSEAQQQMVEVLEKTTIQDLAKARMASQEKLGLGGRLGPVISAKTAVGELAPAPE